MGGEHGGTALSVLVLPPCETRSSTSSPQHRRLLFCTAPSSPRAAGDREVTYEGPGENQGDSLLVPLRFSSAGSLPPEVGRRLQREGTARVSCERATRPRFPGAWTPFGSRKPGTEPTLHKRDGALTALKDTRPLGIRHQPSQLDQCPQNFPEEEQGAPSKLPPVSVPTRAFLGLSPRRC